MITATVWSLLSVWSLLVCFHCHCCSLGSTASSCSLLRRCWCVRSSPNAVDSYTSGSSLRRTSRALWVTCSASLRSSTACCWSRYVTLGRCCFDARNRWTCRDCTLDTSRDIWLRLGSKTNSDVWDGDMGSEESAREVGCGGTEHVEMGVCVCVWGRKAVQNKEQRIWEATKVREISKNV